jgi:hypothetical protein
MSREPFTVGSYVHAIKRGARGLSIVKDDHDRHRLMLMLRHFNDKFCPDNWFRDLLDHNLVSTFGRPPDWPVQDKLVEIICFCLVENHLHLLLKELVGGGIAQFLRRVSIGLSKHFNEKYQERGSLFQGPYRSRTIDDDGYLQYVSAYIQVKNCFELFPRGYKEACQNFGDAFEWAQNYPYCSLGEFMGVRKKAISEAELLSEIFTPREYKEFCQDFIEGRFEDGLEEAVSFE